MSTLTNRVTTPTTCVNALTDTVPTDFIAPQASPAAASSTGVVRLTLTDFRNYAHVRLDLESRAVALTGSNGAGKTNVLEALSYLTSGRGLRGARLGDVGRRAPDEESGRPWAVAAEVETSSGFLRLGTGVDPANTERRAVHIDGKPAKGASVLAQHLSAVWLTPAMDRLFTDSPSERRRFIDRLVTALDPDHASRLAAYDQANRRRARLFRNAERDGAWYASLEDTLARYGVAIAAARRDAVASLNGLLAQEDGPFPAARLGLSGPVDGWLDAMAAVDAEDTLRQSLADDRAAWSAGSEPPTAQGPNRSDLTAVYAATGRSAAECSTGEQKALLVSVILAHVRLQTSRQGQAPLLLLDEAAAHLDADRRTHLFEKVTAPGLQTWLTGTDPSLFSGLGDAIQLLTVSDGRIGPAATAEVVSYPRAERAQPS